MNTHQLPEEQRHGETVVCACFDRTEAEIRDIVERLELATLDDVAAAMLAGSGCTTCRPEIETILLEVAESAGSKQCSQSASETSERAICGEQARH